MSSTKRQPRREPKRRKPAESAAEQGVHSAQRAYAAFLKKVDPEGAKVRK